MPAALLADLSALWWSAAIVLLLMIAGAIVLFCLRRRMLGGQEESDAAGLFDLARLEEMRAHGQLTPEEFRAMRNSALGLDARPRQGHNQESPPAAGLPSSGEHPGDATTQNDRHGGQAAQQQREDHDGDQAR